MYASAIFFLADRCQSAIDVSFDGLEPTPAFSIWRCASLVQLRHVPRARELLELIRNAVRAEWDSRTPPDDSAIYRWLLHMFPIAIEKDWERLRQNLAAAGALVAHVRYGEW